MDFLRDHIIHEDEKAVTTLSLAQTRISRKFDWTLFYYIFFVPVYFKNIVKGRIAIIKLQYQYFVSKWMIIGSTDLRGI